MEVPVCPVHPKGRVVRAGTYGQAPRRRQRWRCHPSNGDASHRFNELLPRLEATAPHCAVCATDLEPWEGQNGPRAYTFPAREIATGLVELAKGATYRDAGREARRVGNLLRKHSYHQYTGRLRHPDYDGQIAANWVDVFAELVTFKYQPTSWPERIAVDSVGFAVTTNALYRAGLRFNFLVVIGYEPGDSVGQVWRIEASPKKTTADWSRLFGSLAGAPERVVSDDDRSIKAAVANSFPGAEHRYCEGHLMRNLRERIDPVFLADDRHPITIALPYALSSEGGFQRFRDAVTHEWSSGNSKAVSPTLRWIHVWEGKLWPQLRTRTGLGPNSTGKVEGINQKLKSYFPKQRASCMTNLERARKLALLLECGFRGEADVLKWAEHIRQILANQGGRPDDQRPHDDPAGVWTLVA